MVGKLGRLNKEYKSEDFSRSLFFGSAKIPLKPYICTKLKAGSNPARTSRGKKFGLATPMVHYRAPTTSRVVRNNRAPADHVGHRALLEEPPD